MMEWRAFDTFGTPCEYSKHHPKHLKRHAQQPQVLCADDDIRFVCIRFGDRTGTAVRERGARPDLLLHAWPHRVHRLLHARCVGRGAPARQPRAGETGQDCGGTTRDVSQSHDVPNFKMAEQHSSNCMAENLYDRVGRSVSVRTSHRATVDTFCSPGQTSAQQGISLFFSGAPS